MLETRYTELIAKKLSGEINSEEEQQLDAWINEDPKHQEKYNQYRFVWSDSKIKRRSSNADRIFIGISAAIQEENPSYSTAPTKRRFFQITAVAATLSLLISSIFVFDRLKNIEEASAPSEVEVVVKSLPKGQKSKIFLPDGSIVWLNAQSTIKYPKRFSEHTRIVNLIGEAFFDVTEDATKPFIVKTDKLDIKVLGTTFNVRNYQNENNTDISLESGKISVHTLGLDKKKYLLSPGEGLSFDDTSGSVTKFHTSRSSFCWKDGTILFEEATFQEVIDKLSRWYGVEFVIENYDNSRWEYSAEFKDEYLDNVLQSLGYSKGFRYEIDQNKVKILFN
ncbi:MAG: FecR domain-containing protein [Cytophagales bacterium]|nr:FecR domain-containing protein [Cytophagales bacterium]